MKAIRVACVETKDWRVEIDHFLTAYRSTPQSTTGATPFQLMFGLSMRTKLLQICRDPEFLHEEIRDRDWQSKIRGKEYADSRRQAKESKIEVGDSVLVRNEKTNKLSPNFQPVPQVVTKRNKER